MLSLIIFSQFGQAQQAQLSLADVLIGLRSKKATLDERNKLLSDAVKVRGITFSLTPEIEGELANTGASGELVEAIRQKGVKIKLASLSKSEPAPVSTPTPAPDFAFYRKRADEYVGKGEFDLAVSDYGKAIELNPKDAVAYLNRARAYSNKKSYDLAMLDYDKTIELSPNESAAYFNRGDLYEKKGNSQKAISEYQKAIDLDAKNESAKINLKRLQDEQTKLEQAKLEQAKLEQAKLEQAKNSLKPKVAETNFAAENTKMPESSKNTQTATPQTVELGQLNSFALKLAKPTYSPIAQRLNAQGKVTVQVMIDEYGKVTSAKAIDGPVSLRSSCEEAARSSKFKPALEGSQPIKATGFIVYKFVNQ